jgi:opacity protein-like surface antigen
MKKGILLASLVIIMATTAWAQPSITLLTFESYTFADKFETEYGSGKIQDGFQWGGGLEFGFSDNAALELIYQNIKTDVTYRGLNDQYTGNVGINYAMLGGTRYAPLNDKISGFGSFDAGVAWSNPDASLDSESVTKFAWGGRLGLRIQASDKVSVRLHAQLLSPVQWSGGGFYFGTGGAGAGVTTGSTIYQFNLGGSLNFRLK